MDERWFIGSVAHNPEIAIRLGQFLAEFATMEGMLSILLSLTIDGSSDNPLGGAILGNVQSVSTRCAIVRSCAESSKLGEIDKEAVRLFVSSIDSINSKRNKYVHSVYETNLDTKDVRMTTWGFQLGKKQTTVNVTADELELVINEIRVVSSRIVKHLLPSKIVIL